MLIADDVRNIGQTLKQCADLVHRARGTLVDTSQIVDRCEAEVTLPVPNSALVKDTVPPNPTSWPLCAAETPITWF